MDEVRGELIFRILASKEIELSQLSKEEIEAGKFKGVESLRDMLCFSLSFCNIDAPMRKISFREEFCSKQRPRLLVPENFLFCRDEIPSLQNCAGRFIST